MSFICIDDTSGEIIGTILAGHDGRRGFIYHVAVAKQHRRKGIANELIGLSIRGLKKAGIKRCSLMVRRENKEAYNFWSVNGWRLRTDLDMFSKDLTAD